MAKRRTSIPKKVRAQVQYLADRKCCVCDGAHVGHQFHHLDEDPSNNDEDNLVFLCANHHAEAGIKGGPIAKLDAATVRVYRSRWYDTVARRRAIEAAEPPTVRASTTQFDDMVEAVQVVELRTSWRSAHLDDWVSVKRALEHARVFASERGVRVRLEVLEFANILAGRVRRKMPLDVVSQLGDVASSAAIQGSFFASSAREFTEPECELVRYGAAIGFSIAHDGAKYRRDLKIVAVGADVLWLALRFARSNRLADCERKVAEYVEWAIDSARRSTPGPFSDAIRWLEFQRDDALALRDDDMPRYPEDLAMKIHK